ncbi:Rossmann-like and DUF2520 domain-containing protein [Gaoshiqia sp. Z1-71]|uniref:Rossmann-like and DUF2520 domain-containing protein n=1 Tax=Gaoshiqia hydrogeniformans TaxID=3290090 RepID=UPI003BF8AA38
MIQKITLLGAGNLATQLGKSLQKAGVEIIQVYSRTEESAGKLANLLGCGFTNKVGEIDLSAGLILVALKDDVLEEVLAKRDWQNSLMVHTAGSIPMDVLAKYTERFGVFYPLQTFSKQRDVDFSQVPVCLEASSSVLVNRLKQLAGQISGDVHEINSEQRKILHLAAVFTCNFVNHLYYLGDRLLQQEGLNFDLLKPLIKETADKVMNFRPFDVQTGPARRFDETIINKHLNLLDKQPELRKIYSFVSESIFLAHKKNSDDIF